MQVMLPLLVKRFYLSYRCVVDRDGIEPSTFVLLRRSEVFVSSDFSANTTGFPVNRPLS